MRNLILTLASFFIFSISFSQAPKVKANKYPSLLWEISGNGMSRPSYLFGTMHVSSKMAFHLSDSFYLGIKNADVVALETDPGSWQEDLSKYDMEEQVYNYFRSRRDNSYNYLDDYLSINTLKAFPYEKLMMQALYSSPAIINSFLYRSGSEVSSDFEEDTYLDLYIFQAGKKWNKKVCGVEDFDESMKLVKEAYADAAKEKNLTERSYDFDEDFSFAKLEEAYRSGNLDWLDSINKVNSRSAAFDEKFVYKRNEIQANSIDSILKVKMSLFVGVGAAHLPGNRGVIELLRKKGYKLRPVKIAERDSKQKDDLEKIRVPVTFSTQTSDDGFFSVSLPGKLFSFQPTFGLLSQQQYSDMTNGSYYMVTRIFTNAGLWGHSTDDVYHKVDSVLYENIPGKMLSKQPITKNGYKGFDITNRTRRGDFQHYNIFITPFEIILFKLSGNGDYVKDSKEADQFFNSIQLKDYKTSWKKYSPPSGGFEVDLPHDAVTNNGANWQFMAYDDSVKTFYEIIRTDIHNTEFVEEDTFDLHLMEESFASSEFIDKQISSKQINHKGYAALDVKYKYKDGSIASVRFLIHGPHYYTLVANAAKENARTTQFLSSFAIKPFIYSEPTKQTDTTLFFTVNSPVPLEKKKKKEMYPHEMFNMGRNEEEDDSLDEKDIYKDKILRNDSTGEAIYISFNKRSKYYFDDDTTTVVDSLKFETPYQNWTYRSYKRWQLPNKTRILEYVMGDPKSSRMVHGKSFAREGIYYRLEIESDTLTKPSSFVTNFFESFTPVDTVKGFDPRKKKSGIFFSDFFSSDTTQHKRAVKNVNMLKFDSADFKEVRKAISSLTWKEKKYLDVKQSFIRKLSDIPTAEASDYLKELYYSAGDTVDVQYTVLSTLLDQKNDYSFKVFKDIMVNEPPVLDVGSSTSSYPHPPRISYDVDEDYYGGGGEFFDYLSDSLKLTKTIFRDILPLININDYEEPVISLLETMVDSSMIEAKDYEIYMSKFLIEAKQLLKKQIISEKNKSIEKAQSARDEEEKDRYRANDDEKGSGNYKLSSYAKLLMPFWESNPAVPTFMNQLLNSNDKRLKYNTTFLLLRYKKNIPDTLLNYFAAMDEYRYELYSDLRVEKLLNLFPAKYMNQMDLARSEIKNYRTYNTPDSFVYIDKLPLQQKDRNGFVYFFKYKEKKDDQTWKLATVGLLPADPKKYEFETKEQVKAKSKGYDEYWENRESRQYDFTEITETKINKEDPLKDQLNKALKRMKNAKHKSAEKFYVDEHNVFSSALIPRD
jgi:uncharacterized protein YbaP (TraB family)